jgi:hypothetical protein
MTTFTKEQAQAIFDLKAGYTLGHTDVAILQELARIALASLEAEPDYIRYDCGCCGWETLTDWRDNDVCPKCNHHPIGKTELCTAPPAPVSMKDHQIRELVNELRDIAVEYHGTQQLRERIARTVRAAMLQGAENAESRCTIKTAPELDSLPKNAESRCGNFPIPSREAIIAGGVLNQCPQCHGDSYRLKLNGWSHYWCDKCSNAIISEGK